MRTTVTLADDVAAAVEQFRRERGIGISEAVNELIRKALVSPPVDYVYENIVYDLGLAVDITCMGDLDGMEDEERYPELFAGTKVDAT